MDKPDLKPVSASISSGLLDDASRIANSDGAVKNIWHRLSEPVDVIAKIGTVLILVLALLQYWGGQIDAKRERSLALVDEWVNGGFPVRIANLNSYLLDGIEAVQHDIEASPETMREKLWENAEENTFGPLAHPSNAEEIKLRGDIDALFQFFSRAEICVSSSLCHKTVVRDYFGVEIPSLVTSMEPFLRRVREDGLPNYGAATENLLLLLTD